MQNAVDFKVSNFVKQLSCDNGAYRFSPHISKYNSLSTCFALLTYEILDEAPSNIDKSIAFLMEFQCEESGLFIDESILGELRGTHDVDYINHQVTYHILMVLTAYGVEPSYALTFLEDYKNEEYLCNWLHGLNWSNPWLISNNIMFILNFLISQDEIANKKYIDFILDWLDVNQSSENGMWNLGKKSTLHNQMAGAFHFQYFYDYFKREKHKINLIVDKTLLIQEYDGLFSYASGGGSCDDLDAIDLLCRNYEEVDNQRKKKIFLALSKANTALLHNQNIDGGFCWAKRKKFKINNIINIIPVRLLLAGELLDAKRSFLMKAKNTVATVCFKDKLVWQFSGIKEFNIGIDQSDIFSTWFRLLSITMIDKVKNNSSLTIRKKAGIGFLK